jgi:succinate dehydrogenase flavin-adding protein (antitoxin of CptAB toxin-antitoxin module)
MALPPGLLENDLFIERFFRRYEETLTARQVEGLQLLMDLADNDLLDLLLARKEPEGPWTSRWCGMCWCSCANPLDGFE